MSSNEEATNLEQPTEDELKVRLKINILNKDAWLALARMLKRDGDLYRSEICYVGTLYCDMDDRDIVLEWLGVYATLRTDKESTDKEQSKKLLETTRIIEKGMREVYKDPVRLIQELKSILYFVDHPQMATVSV